MGYLYYLDYDHSGGKKYQAAHDNTIYGNNIVKITALEYPNPNYQPLCTPDNPGAEFTSPEMDVVPGVFGNAVNFTGSDYVDCGNPDEFNFGTGDWTISAWAETTNTAQQHIFANGGDGSGGIRYALGREGTNNLAWVVVDDNIKKVRVASTTGIADGVWHHLVGMRKGDEIQIYIDGELQGAATLPPGYDLSGTSQANALIGAITNFQGGYIENFFDGLIDEVHLFDRALSVAEIQQLHNTPGALGDEKVYYNGDTIDKTNPVHLLPDLSTGNNDAKINVQTCPMVYEPPYLAGANAYLGQGAVINNNIRGYSGGSVIDEPDNFPYIGVWFGDIGQWRDYNFGYAGYKDGNPAEPYYYDYMYYPGLVWNTRDNKWVEGIYLPKTEPMDPIYPIPDPSGNPWFLKNNYVTGFEPIKGAGGIGQQAPLADMSPEYEAWSQAFEEFLETNPTEQDINDWLAQNPEPPRQ